MKECNVEAVITSYNQGEMILEALASICKQTVLPARVIIVDDGSSDENSIRVLHAIEEMDAPIPVLIHHQKNAGVSAARNTGISLTNKPFVLVLDGDDRLKETYIEEVTKMLEKDESMVAASSWMQTFGVLESTVKPSGGAIASFLARNCCPATHILRREAWKQCGGYDETMKSGFEDWDFFLSMLETRENATIGMVENPLLEYRTAPASSNVKSMSKRIPLMKYIISKHEKSYHANMLEALLGIELTSMERLHMWEQEVLSGGASMETSMGSSMESTSVASRNFMESPSYGDGGMAAAVRVATERKL